jgi:hypothetical protein
MSRGVFLRACTPLARASSLCPQAAVAEAAPGPPPQAAAAFKRGRQQQVAGTSGA